MSSSNDSLIGRTIGGNIEIRRLIGAGGMGRVYEGYQAHLGRALAVKVLGPEHSQNTSAVEYFHREARACSQLRHPNIIQIFDYGRDSDGMLYLAMELIPGRSLRDVLKDPEHLNDERIVTIISQTLDALQEAHAHGVIHRDLKPDNLMVERTREGSDFVKVLDFGIARILQKEDAATEEAGPMTQAGLIMGTPHYMSPEQATSEPIDARSDLYSVGSLLYEMLTGRPPFPESNAAAVLVSLLRDPVPLPRTVTQRPVHPGLEAVSLKALEKRPEARYQSAREFRSALKACLQPAASSPNVSDEQPTSVYQATANSRASGERSMTPSGERPAPTPAAASPLPRPATTSANTAAATPSAKAQGGGVAAAVGTRDTAESSPKISGAGSKSDTPPKGPGPARDLRPSNLGVNPGRGQRPAKMDSSTQLSVILGVCVLVGAAVGLGVYFRDTLQPGRVRGPVAMASKEQITAQVDAKPASEFLIALTPIKVRLVNETPERILLVEVALEFFDRAEMKAGDKKRQAVRDAVIAHLQTMQIQRLRTSQDRERLRLELKAIAEKQLEMELEGLRLENVAFE